MLMLVTAGAVVLGISFAGVSSAEPRALALGAEQATPSVAPDLTAGTFLDPPATVRPKYRWWQPLAYTDDTELRNELAQMQRAGGGGAEVAAFGVDGSGHNKNPFLQTYGFGTPLWRHKVQTMLEAAKADGLGLDLTIGPRWPATVPTVSDVNNPAAQQMLVYASEFHAGGTARSGPLPSDLNAQLPAGADKKLVAVVAARCTDAACAKQSSAPRLLDRSSVVDLTDRVDANGDLSYSFPGDPTATYVLLAFYQAPTGQSMSGYTPTGTNYVLDDLGTAGAQAIADFYDNDILTPSVQSLVDQLSSVDIFEDSLELGGTEKWTSDMVAQWARLRGYSPVDVLPALTGTGGQGITAQPAFDFPGDLGSRVRNDYRQTMSDLYMRNHLDVLRTWAHQHHMQTRIQPYGTSIDSAAAGEHIDVPEGESLAFGQSTGDYSDVQDYRVIASGAHLSGAPVVSDECCAFKGSVWSSTAGNATDLSNLQAVYRGFAGGVTQVVWHGFPYLTRGPAGTGEQEVWPGMSYGGNTSVSEAFGAKGNPSWADYKMVNDNLARMQLVLRQGKPRFDLAVYRQDFGLNTGGGQQSLIQSSSALAAHGYTYEYLSPDALHNSDAVVRNGTLFPDRSAYQAVVLAHQRSMPVDTAQRLLQFTKAGLPIVVIGDPPSSTPGAADETAQDAQLKSVIAELMAQPNVVRVATEADAPAALQRLGVAAAAAHDTNSDAILDVRRHTDSVDYYYLYNQTRATAAQSITLAGTGIPYRLNTWTGKITPIADYTRHDGTVTVPVVLSGNDAEVIALTGRRDATFQGAAPVPPSAGLAPGAHQISPTNWTLSVDSWTPGPSDLPGDTAHQQLGPVTITAGADGQLPAWSAITPANGYPVNLADVSGVGTYTAHVTLDQSWQRVRDAYLDLGSVIDTARVMVNGTALPPIDQASPDRIDVGPYLRPGENTIVVTVASTLLNAVRVAPGTGASSRTPMDYGMTGPVTLTPVAGADAYLPVQPLARSLPLAAGGYNRADILVTNSSSSPVAVSLTADAPAGITADVPTTPTTVAAHQWAVIPIGLRDSGVSSGTSRLSITADASNGIRTTTSVALTHSDNLALNAQRAEMPEMTADASQARYPAWLANDGSTSTFWVSSGQENGQGPSAADPSQLSVDLGAPDEVSSVKVVSHSSYGPRSYDVQTSMDGRTWQTAAHVEAAKAGATTTFATTTARFVRLYITRGWDTPQRNVQVSEVEVR